MAANADRTGDVRADEPVRVVSGDGYEHHGYWMGAVPEEDDVAVELLERYAPHLLRRSDAEDGPAHGGAGPS